MSWRSSRAATSTPPAWWTAPAGSCSRSGPCPASPRSPTPTRPGPAQVSADGQRSLVVVELAPELDDDAALAVAEDVAAALRRIDAPEVLVGGRLLAERAFGEQAIEDAVVGESVALVVLAVALVVLLGGLVAAGVPLAVALAGVACTLLALSLLTIVGPVSEFAVNVVTLLGIGLAIDYSLLMISRFREERAARAARAPARLLARTMATSGRAVLVSGLAVAAALCGLFAFADPLLAAMALGGALVAGVAVARGPDPRPRARRDRPSPHPGTGNANRAVASGRPVHRRAAAAPGHLRPAPSRRRDPRRGGRTPAAEPAAPAGQPGQLRCAVVAGRRRGTTDVRGDAARLSHGRPRADHRDHRGWHHPAAGADAHSSGLGGVDRVDVRDDVTGPVTVADVTPVDPAEAQTLVRRIRALDTEATVLVAGPAAELVDTKDLTVRHLPIALIVIIGASGLLLFPLTGSVVVPVKALILNLVTLAATMGVLVAVFQWGVGASLLGFEPWGALDITTPLLLFVFIFGLSMDYEVFLLARIKEEWDRRTHDDRAASDRAVLAGIRATGPVVTAAAVLMGIVFLGFALGELVAVKEIGVGMAVAVLLDVTIVRGLLLPATMSLLGRANWWRPRRPGVPVSTVR